MKKVFLLCMVVIASMTSCKKEETKPAATTVVATDVRDQIVGVYNAETEVSYDGGNPTTTSILTISKDPSNSKGLIFSDIDQADGTKYIYKVEAVSKASNGLTFNVPVQQVLLPDGSYAEWVGTTKYLLDGNKFDGGFSSSTKTLNYGFSGNMLINGEIIPFIGDVTAVKVN